VCRSAAIVIIAACLSAGVWLGAHTFYTTKITWSQDVSRIVYRNCASCHHPGGSSFPLMTYQQARPWAEAIKQQVLERRMPPWNAVKGFGDFKDDRGLTQEDLEIVGEWVEGGAPEGNPIYLPAAPDFNASDLSAHSFGSQDPAGGRAGEKRLSVSGQKVLGHAVEALGLEPEIAPGTGALQVVAAQPDGAVEPLIWVENFNSNCKRTYYFREPMFLPAGTRITLSPPQGRVSLIVK
jgi:hypothetical protein